MTPDEIGVLHFGHGEVRMIPCEHIESHNPAIMFKLSRPTKIGKCKSDPDAIPLFVFSFANVESLDGVIATFTELRTRFLQFTTA